MSLRILARVPGVSTAPAERPPLRVDDLRDLDAWSVDVVAASPSTNAALAERARSGASARSVLVAEHQTAGRGRIDRTFTTPDRAALTFSVLLRPTLAPQRWPWLPLVAGLAVRSGIRRLHPSLDVQLKWPNDVLIASAPDDVGKVCGILTERIETPDGPAAIIGMGINASTTREELPVPSATSLLVAGNGNGAVDRTALLVEILADLDVLVRRWEADEVDGLREEYAAACATLHRRVRAELPGGTHLEGDAVGIDDGGSLVVETVSGRRVVSAGDLIHVRASGPEPS